MQRSQTSVDRELKFIRSWLYSHLHPGIGRETRQGCDPVWLRIPHSQVKAQTGSINGVVDRMEQTTENFLRMEAVFNEALVAPPDARRALIEAQCVGDREMAAEVFALLEACEAEERLAAARRLEPEPGRDSQPESRQIGPYQLDRLLGRGGMGAVYLAHRADGKFEQQVAIKLIDLPLATEHLPRAIPPGAADSGRPAASVYRVACWTAASPRAGDLYLAMEYVDGVPIHRYCDQQALSAAAAARAFSARLRGGAVRSSELRRPSRSQAGQHSDRRRRHAAAAGLRHRQAALALACRRGQPD